MVTRERAAEVLEEIALLLELKGENPFKVRAYRTGAEAVRTFPGDLMEQAAEGKFTGVKGIGDAISTKLHELATTGALAFHRDLVAEFPPTVFELFEVQGLGPKKVKHLYDELGIASVSDLKAACADGRVEALPGFGAKSVEKVMEAIAFREGNADRFRQDEVAAAVEEVLGFLGEHPDVLHASVAGSYRRGKETVHDLDFLAATRKPEAVTAAFAAAPFVSTVVACGTTKASVRLACGVPCDLRAVDNAAYPFALQYFTGSKEHNVALRGRAQKLGFTLNEYRLARAGDKDVDAPGNITDEAGVYRALGLDFIPPELRENTGEIEAAEAGELPRLVEPDNLRGTFHNHTTASDGRATLAEMAAAAQELGLEYLGVADHSKSSFQANGLNADRLLDQIAEIGRLNAGFDGFRLFAGVECDILKDGTLDFPDDVLAGLDYVVASVHGSFSLPEAEMTRRVIRAIENPYVTMLGHLTGRLLLKRDPYQIDVPAVIEAAAATGTVVELNANPWRLDMDWRWWKLAKEKGVKCAINPDAHSTRGLQDLYFGVRAARKGWLERGDVINCLPLGKVEGALGRKRESAAPGPPGQETAGKGARSR